jgi:phosphoglycerol transferase MdoB-like AlkP superfamily enzyme
MVVGELSKPEEIEVKLAAEELPTDTRLVSIDGPKRDAGKRNVVVVLLESTRARSTTLYRKELDTTPFLAELAGESLVARKAYAVVPHTSKALVATLCGISPPLDTDKTESEPGRLPAKCVPELLKEQGYETAFFQSATGEFERRPQLVENFGYEEFVPMEEMPKEGFQEVNYFGYEDEIMLDPSKRWLEENAQNGPFMATYLTVTPHHNYVVPDRYEEEDYSEDKELDRYMNTVRYQDFFLEKLFDQYKDMGLYKDTVFVVLGDHGEGFGEHGLKQHDNTIYNEGLRIPLLVHDPRDPQQKIVEDPTNELDVLPTVVDALGYRVRGGSYPGSSMFGPLGERVLRASCYYENVCLARIEGDEKYIYNYGNKGQELYDLSEDPYERRNIIDERKEEEISALRRDLLHWRARVEAAYEERPPDKYTVPPQEKAPVEKTGSPEDAPSEKAPLLKTGSG